MSCDQTMRKAARVNMQMGVPALTGHAAYLTGRSIASADFTVERAGRNPQALGVELLRAGLTALGHGYHMQRFIDKRLLDSPIPTSIGLLALGAGSLTVLSLLVGRLAVQKIWLRRRYMRHLERPG